MDGEISGNRAEKMEAGEVVEEMAKKEERNNECNTEIGWSEIHSWPRLLQTS